MSRLVDRIRHQFSDPRPAKRAGLILLLLAAFTVVGTSAWAYWTTTGSGTASAATGTLNPPTAVAATNTSGSSTVGVSWTAPVTGTTPTGYNVKRTNTNTSATADVCGTLTTPVTTTSCNDLTVPDGTYQYTVTAVYHGWSATSTPVNNVTVTSDVTPPTVSSIVRAGGSAVVKAGPLSWTVTFAEPVTGVSAGNFTLATLNTGGTAPSLGVVTAVGGSPATTWTVNSIETGTTGSNAGSIGLNLTSTASIADVATNTLSATLPVTGPAFTYDTTAPTVSSIVRAGGSAVVKAGPLSWTVTFAEPVNGVTTSNFGFVTGAVTGTPTFTSVTPSGSAPSATWTVATSETSVTGTNSGSIGLNLTSVGSIADVATNALSGTPVTGEAYAYDTTGPSLVSATSGGGTAGKMETGDTLSLTFDEALAPASVPSSVTVTEARATGNTTLTIPGLIQSSVISNGYLGGNNSSGTASSMSIVLSNGNKTVTITLGTVTLAGSGVATGTGTVTLSPGAALTDNAANGAITASTAALPKLF